MAASGPQIQRPVYREGRLLEVAELRAEQQARTGALTRHEGNVHAPGVAFGLEVKAAVGGVQVQPGLAVDGAGHYLVLEQSLTASLADGENVTVSIVWRGATSQIELSDVPPPAPASRTSSAWPVVLGRAGRAGGTVTIDTDSREELELRAVTLTDPAGGSRVVLGGQRRRSSQIFSVQLADGNGGFGAVTTVHRDGTGHIAVVTNVTDAAQADGVVALATAVPAPSAASPWSLYRTTVTRPDKTVREQLRLEIGEVKTGGDPQALELLIAQGGTGAGQDLLHVDATGNVTIPNGLVVQGVTTVGGGAGAGGSGGAGSGATTLSGLVAQEANVLAMSQALLNQLTNTDLRMPFPSPAPAASAGVVSYTLQLANSSAATITAVAAYETAVAGSTVLSKQFVVQGVNLPAAGSYNINRTITAGTGQNVTVTVLAIGAGQDGQPRTATLGFQIAT